jgi:glycosyltransferase involved in cell wall biosynthesis
MKIKILVDAHVFDSFSQGTTTYLSGLYNNLVVHSEVEIYLAASDITKLKDSFTDERFKFVKLPKSTSLKRLLFDFPRIIKENKIDIAHFQYVTPLRKTCKFVNTIHDLLFMEYPQYFPLKYRIIKYCAFFLSARNSDLVCTVSAYSCSSLKKYFTLGENKLFITPNGISRPSKNETEFDKTNKLKPYILFVSRMEPRKNHLLLLKAYLELELYKQEYNLIYIGKINDIGIPDFFSFYDSLTQDIKDKIYILEGVSLFDLQSLYKNASLFVYPSAAEGFGIPPLEAVMNGCKVICSNQTAMSDFTFLKNYLFDPNDFQNFKSKIETTLLEKKYPFENIQKEILRLYNWQNISDSFLGRLKNLL